MCLSELNEKRHQLDKVSLMVESLKRVLLHGFSISIDYASELLSALSIPPTNCYPISLVHALSFCHIWIARLEIRLCHKLLHPKANLQIVLSAFISKR